MSHTPGSWYLQVPGVVSYWSANLECIRVFAPAGSFAFGQEVALVPIDKDADARLIAAAPDLLEACEVALGTIELHVNPSSPTAEILRAAIAKAKYNNDPTPWCHQCGARTRERCKCGPIARND